MTDHFIIVPAVTLPSGTLVPAFQVGQYACGRGEDSKAIVTPKAAPWVCINYRTAVQACKAAGYRLITELQWIAIAHDVANQACNWTGRVVGEGELFQGLRKWSVKAAQPGVHQPTDATERRWLTLSNGERIYDMNGNAFQWVFDDAQGDAEGIVARPFDAASPSLQAPFPPMKKGMGWRPPAGANWFGFALLRGGYWGSGSDAGAFCLSYDGPGYEGDDVGFRCTKSLGQ